MRNQYSVHVDSKGHVLIPAEVRKAMGIEPKSLMLLSQEGGEIRLVPGEVIPRRQVRMVPREELAQVQRLEAIGQLTGHLVDLSFIDL